MIKSKHTNTISMFLREDSFQLYLWNSVLIFFKIFSINIWEIAWFWNIHLLIELLAPGFSEEVCLSLDSKRVIKSSREVHLWVKNSPPVLVMDNRRNRARRRHHHRITILCLWKILKNIFNTLSTFIFRLSKEVSDFAWIPIHLWVIWMWIKAHVYTWSLSARGLDMVPCYVVFIVHITYSL